MTDHIRKIFLVQLGILFFLILMHFFPADASFYANKVFNLNGESNIPAWYSTMLLFSVAVSALIISMLRYDSEKLPAFWLFFGCVYCFLTSAVSQLSRNRILRRKSSPA